MTIEAGMGFGSGTADKYYDRLDVRSFGESTPLYRGMVGRLVGTGATAEPHSPFHLPEPPTIVLGGFHSPDSLHEADGFITEIAHGHPYSLVAVDRNSAPIQRLTDVAPHVRALQGNLQTLDIGGKPVDMVLLDFTLNFMSPEEMNAFFAHMKTLLSQNGLVIAAVDTATTIRGMFTGHVQRKCFDGVPRHEYTERVLVENARKAGLKCVMLVEWRVSRSLCISGLAFSRLDSSFKEDSDTRIFPELNPIS